ncbi:MAG: MmgE/PrpD family protein, partial [Desulfurococcales archaeon]|nr:MmgE/PrpD family protein [Desulfurococcales archaeon]
IVEAAEKLASEIDPSRINKIEARVFKEAIVVAGKKYPKTLPEARFSIPYLIVTTLVYGELNFDTLGRGLNNPLVIKLMDLVKLKEDPEYTSLYPEKQPAHLTIHQDNGTIEAYVEYPRGDPRRGVNLRDIILKAHQLSHESRDNRIKKLADTLKMASHKESFSLLLDAIAR